MWNVRSQTSPELHSKYTSVTARARWHRFSLNKFYCQYFSLVTGGKQEGAWTNLRISDTYANQPHSLSNANQHHSSVMLRTRSSVLKLLVWWYLKFMPTSPTLQYDNQPHTDFLTIIYPLIINDVLSSRYVLIWCLYDNIPYYFEFRSYVGTYIPILRIQRLHRLPLCFMRGKWGSFLSKSLFGKNHVEIFSEPLTM